MQKSFKNEKNLLDSIMQLKRRHEYLEQEFVRLVGQKPYRQIISFYDTVIAKLDEEIKTLPIGYRYSGEFYLKEPYLVPIRFEKIIGSAFMREDLVSWKIEHNTLEPERDYGYCRAIFKSPDPTTEIKKDEAELVYLK